LPLLCLVAAARLACAQAFFTGETGGKGASSLFVAGNVAFVRDYTIPGNFWTAYTRGVHHRIDAFVYYGNSPSSDERSIMAGLDPALESSAVRTTG
jgi:hypothetical protein